MNEEPTMMHPRLDRQGFTLVELLLAMAVAAILFAGMFMTLDQVVRTRNDLSNQATPYVIGPAILDCIARDLSNVYFYDFVENNSFYGSDAQLNGREADAISFITLSKAFAPHPDLPAVDEFNVNRGRYSYANEVAYVCRRGHPAGTPFLELWRREDFYVDDSPHSGGEFVLLYDRIHSIQFKYISRNAKLGGGLSEEASKNPEDMLQDGWNGIEEQGVPRCILVILEIYARDEEREIEEVLAADENAPRIYRFTRYIALPQVHMSRESEQQIASWDGEYNEATATTASNPNAAAGVGGAGGRPRAGQGQGDGSGRPNRPGRPGQQGTPPPRGAANNPFLQALQGQGARPRGGGGGAGGLSGLFGGR
jgi:prepilin-type N-terminal cleavage/methylation domain-containing protein